MIRVGQGFDSHAFERGRALVVGGVMFDEPYGLGGHSDGDVLSHAVADAVLGACALGDLGVHFPPNERWRDASSLAILSETARLAAESGWEIANVDATVVAAKPRLALQREQMRQNVAGALGVDASAVSVKATTTDGLGFTGRGEGMAAMAVVLVRQRAGTT